jgi:ankyrin repeat protein
MSLDWKKMHSLVRENKIAELENFKAHLAETDENKENLFHSAAYSGREETCTYLFDNGLNDIDRMNKWNTNPIQIACVRNNFAALKFLLDKKANIDVKVELGGGSYGGDNNDPNKEDLFLCFGDSLLHICVCYEALDCLLILLPFCEHHLDVKNDLGRTPREVGPQFWDNAITASNAKASEAKRLADEEAYHCSICLVT